MRYLELVSGLSALRNRMRRFSGDEATGRPAASRTHERPARAVESLPAAARDGAAPILGEARERLSEIAVTSARASKALRHRATIAGGGPAGPPAAAAPVRDLLEALVDSIEAMQHEASRLTALLDRTQSRLTRPSNGSTAEPNGQSRAADGGDDDPDEPVPMERVRALIKIMVGAGASREEVAAWVFREHGVVISDRMVEEAVRAEAATGERHGPAAPPAE